MRNIAIKLWGPLAGPQMRISEPEAKIQSQKKEPVDVARFSIQIQLS